MQVVLQLGAAHDRLEETYDSVLGQQAKRSYRKKIGIVSNLYPPDARGRQNRGAAVADALYERGHKVFVLTTQPYDGLRSLFGV